MNFYDSKNIMKHGIAHTLLLIIVPVCFGLEANGQALLEEIQDDPTRSAGIYCSYRYEPVESTPPPKGYKAFYISHYGRHGSRWLSRETDYTEIEAMMERADTSGALSRTGKDVYEKVRTICADAKGRAGSLSPEGVLQHRDIAGRMIDDYPEVFRKNAAVNASSTTYPRCILSMAAFCERLKETVPSLRISRNADLRTTRVLNFFHSEANPEINADFRKFVNDGRWKEDYAAMSGDYIMPQRLMGVLLSDSGFFSRKEAEKLMHGLFRLASDIQCTELDGTISLYDIFTDEELYLMSVYDNYYYFMLVGPSAINRQAPEFYARILLEDIISRADSAILDGTVAADLRFGHDSNIVPLMTLLGLTELDFDRGETDPGKVAEKWSVHRLTPMAANIQFIFYRKGKASSDKDVLVKIMHNETEMHLPLDPVSGPYYSWHAVKEYYLDAIGLLSYPEGGIE